MNYEKERDNLEKIANWFIPFGEYTYVLIEFSYQSIKPFFSGESCLELGCGYGIITEKLVNFFKKVVTVEGSSKMCEFLRGKIKAQNLEVINSMFEDFEPKQTFNTIIMAHILEHVEDPVLIMKRAKKWIKNDGVIIINVPNANSIHRQIGVKMGLLKSIDDLNETDLKVGHRRVFTMDRLKNDINKAGLNLKEIGGIFMKPLTNSQMQKYFTKEMMNAFYELGKEYPEIAAELVAVCGI